MLKLRGDGRGVMGGDGEKCGVAVLGILGSRKWVRGFRARAARFVTSVAARRLQTLGAIRVARGCMAPRVPSTIRSS